MTDPTTRASVCRRCGDAIKQFDPDGGLWVGNLKSGGAYDCPEGGLHQPQTTEPLARVGPRSSSTEYHRGADAGMFGGDYGGSL